MDLEGQHDGIEQTIAKGSWVDIPALALPGGAVGFAATIWPTLLAAGQQAVLNWAGVGGSLTVGIGERGASARLATGAEIIEVETGIALTERAWHDIACLFDPATGVLSIAQAPRKIRLDHDERATKSSGAPRTALAGTGAAAIAAEREGQHVAHHFNGKIDDRASPMAAPALTALLPRKAPAQKRPRSPNGIFPSGSRLTLRPISGLPRRTASASICRRVR